MSERLLPDVVRELFAWLPETEEFLSHGSPCFRVVGGRQFGSLNINGHGDRGVSLWLRAAEGMQADLVAAQPDQYFAPPYVGVKGWLGLRLDRDPDWSRVVEHVRDAWLTVAPKRLAAQLPQVPDIAPPSRPMREEEIDPLRGSRGQAWLARIDDLCRQWPEVRLGEHYGSPCWYAGRKAFCKLQVSELGIELLLLVGGEEQSMRLDDPRFHLPRYFGARGWLGLRGDVAIADEELATLIELAWRRVALKRMLKALGEGQLRG